MPAYSCRRCLSYDILQAVTVNLARCKDCGHIGKPRSQITSDVTLLPGAKLERHDRDDGRVDYWFWCPGCDMWHRYTTKRGSTDTNGKPPEWRYNGNPQLPTFEPSLLYTGLCHLRLTNGVLHFYSNSKHRLKGQHIALQEIPSDLRISS